MNSFKALITVIALGFGCMNVCRAGLGNDDSWFNGSSVTPITPTSSGQGAAFIVPPPPPGPTKEQLEQKDLKEAADDFVDKGNKSFKAQDWGHAVAFYRKALEYDPDSDDAIHNLKVAQGKILAEQERQEEIQRSFVESRDRSIEQDRANYKNQLEKLMVEADHIRVPPPAVWMRVHEGFILGLFDPQDGVEVKFANAKSPFTGRPLTREEVRQEVFSSTDSQTASELLRGLLDHLSIGEYTLSTQFGKNLVQRLNGIQFDRLIAHSNGGTIAEALIKKSIIKVNELNVVGGDRSLINQAGYQKLIDSGKVKRVIVWINPGDIIPIGSSLSYITPMGAINVVPLMTSAEHYANKLAGNNQGGDAKVEYRLLKGSEYVGQGIHVDQTRFDAHDLINSYFHNISSYFVSHGTSGTN